jgi:glutathione synthase/RimK-type ligase-like ATP-grasp enzyme
MNIKSAPKVIFYTTYANEETPPHFKLSYRLANEQLLHNLISKGAHVFIGYNAKDNYLGDFRFAKTWRVTEYQDGIHYTIENTATKFDIVYNNASGDLLEKIPDSRKINSTFVKNVFNNKYLTYLFAPDFQTKTYFIENELSFHSFKMTKLDQQFAIKEIYGSGGKQVFIGTVRDYDYSLAFPLIAQEFVDTSGGVPDLTTGTHDIRVRIFNGKVIGGSLRIPPEGVTKITAGNTPQALLAEEIPLELKKKTQLLDKRLASDTSRFFAADWGLDKETNQWKLFEMNAAPGLPHESEDGAAANQFLDLLAKCIVDSVG